MPSFILSTPTRYRISVSAFYFAQGLVYSSWASRIPDIKKSLGLNDADWGTVLLMAPIGQITAMALSGYLVTRFGSRTCLRIAVTLYPLFLMALGFSSETWQLVIALLAFGMAGNLHNISVNTQGIGVERLHKGNILGSFHGVWSLAGFTGGLISALMIKNGIIPAYHFVMMFGVNMLILLIMGRSLLPRDARPPEKPKTGRRFVKPDKYILVLGGIAFACMICEGTMFNWSSLYFQDIVHTPPEYVGYGYIAFMSTMTCGRFLADRMAGKLGIPQLFRISGALTITGYGLAVLFPNLSICIIGFMLVGLGVSSVVPLCYSLAGKSKTMHPGVAVASISTIGFLGFLIGPPLIGYIAEVGSLRWSFALTACLGLLVIVLVPKLIKLRNSA